MASTIKPLTEAECVELVDLLSQATGQTIPRATHKLAAIDRATAWLDQLAPVAVAACRTLATWPGQIDDAGCERLRSLLVHALGDADLPRVAALSRMKPGSPSTAYVWRLLCCLKDLNDSFERVCREPGRHRVTPAEFDPANPPATRRR